MAGPEQDLAAHLRRLPLADVRGILASLADRGVRNLAPAGADPAIWASCLTVPGFRERAHRIVEDAALAVEGVVR